MGLELEDFDAAVTALNAELRNKPKDERPLDDLDDISGMIHVLTSNALAVQKTREAARRAVFKGRSRHDLEDK